MNELRITPAIQELMLPLFFCSKRADRHMIGRNPAHINIESFNSFLYLHLYVILSTAIIKETQKFYTIN